MDEPLAQTNGGYTTEEQYAATWQGPQPVKLPSGQTFLLRKPQILKMMRLGQIPNPLMEVVREALLDRDERDLEAEAKLKGVTIDELREQIADETTQEADEHPPVPQAEISAELAATGLRFMDVMAWAAIVRPRVEIEPPASDDSPLTASGAISYDSLPDRDIQFIISWANEETAEAAQFRGDVGRESRGGDSREVRAAAV